MRYRCLGLRLRNRQIPCLLSLYFISGQAERQPIPNGAGCYVITLIGECCKYTDGRTEGSYAGQKCIPAKARQSFIGAEEIHNRVCEPECEVDGTCGGGKVQSDKAGTCSDIVEAPTPVPVTPAPTTAATTLQRPSYPGGGCYLITEAEECCKFSDGRTEAPYGGELCIPAASGRSFVGAEKLHHRVCEPECHVEGTCGLAAGNHQLDAAGTCPDTLSKVKAAVCDWSKDMNKLKKVSAAWSDYTNQAPQRSYLSGGDWEQIVWPDWMKHARTLDHSVQIVHAYQSFKYCSSRNGNGYLVVTKDNFFACYTSCLESTTTKDPAAGAIIGGIFGGLVGGVLLGLIPCYAGHCESTSAVQPTTTAIPLVPTTTSPPIECSPTPALWDVGCWPWWYWLLFLMALLLVGLLLWWCCCQHHDDKPRAYDRSLDFDQDESEPEHSGPEEAPKPLQPAMMMRPHPQSWFWVQPTPRTISLPTPEREQTIVTERLLLLPCNTNSNSQDNF